MVVHAGGDASAQHLSATKCINGVKRVLKWRLQRHGAWVNAFFLCSKFSPSRWCHTKWRSPITFSLLRCKFMNVWLVQVKNRFEWNFPWFSALLGNQNLKQTHNSVVITRVNYCWLSCNREHIKSTNRTDCVNFHGLLNICTCTKTMHSTPIPREWLMYGDWCALLQSICRESITAKNRSEKQLTRLWYTRLSHTDGNGKWTNVFGSKPFQHLKKTNLNKLVAACAPN